MKPAATIAFHTLGCKLNYSETATLARRMESDGFVKKSFDEVADVYVINTCSVTENADRECRMLVRRIQRRAPGASVVITGCYAQLKPKEIAQIEGVDLVLGAAEKMELGRHLQTLVRSEGPATVHCGEIDAINGFNAAYSLHDRTRTFLKVQDGCDYSCSFCTIPLARGHSRSDTVAGVLEKLRGIESAGIKEVVLTGINLGDFGKGTDGEKRQDGFLQLLEAIDAQSSIPRFRISSIEPNLLSEAIIRFVAKSSRIMPHFHIPLQSGSNYILGLMKRRYRRELYADRIAAIKAALPRCGIGVDVITGFPGEDEKAFQETALFLENLDVNYLHVFTYSERENTPAALMPGKVPQNIRQERNKILRLLSYQKSAAFAQQYAGTVRPVLWEKSKQPGMLEGFTDNGIRVMAPARDGWLGSIQRWRL